MRVRSNTFVARTAIPFLLTAMISPDGAFGDETPICRIIQELAEAAGSNLTSLSPIANSVDPEAVDRLLTGESGSEVQLTFHHEGYRIYVDSAGNIDIQPEP